MTRYRLSLQPLTAVHIGCGESLTPFEYLFGKNTQKEDIFIRFYPERIIQGLSAQKKAQFMELTESNDISAIRKFLLVNWNINSIYYTARVTTGFLREFNAKQGSTDNSFEIEADYRATGQTAPVIPGSSIKGAFRTAVLNERASARQLSSPDFRMDTRARSDTELQRWALQFSKPNDDPFRSISIGDCSFPPRGTQLVSRMLQYHLGPQNTGLFGSMAIFAEVLGGVLSESDAVATTDFLHLDELDDMKTPQFGALKHKAGGMVIDAPIDIEEIVTSCDTFYNRAFSYEFDTFYRTSDDDALYKSAENLADLVDSLKPKGEHLVRIGRWSHVESVTLEKPYRRPLGRHGYGRTRTLLDYNGTYLPMGWCAFKIEKET